MRQRYFIRLMLFFCINTVIVFAQKNPRNVILLIGDGMGIDQLYSGIVASPHPLNIERFSICGFSKTNSANHFATDSGAAATAIACGVKTNNGLIGMSADSVTVKSIFELAKEHQLSTGIVASSSLTHSTPAAFVSHQTSYDMYDEIASDYFKSGIDVFVGGGKRYFEKREDGQNISEQLKSKGYQICYSLPDFINAKGPKVAGFLYDDQAPPLPQRSTMLPDASKTAIQLLSPNKKGFILLIEGAQIDWACHDGNIQQLVREIIDFDSAIGKALDFAERDKHTLVIVTGDHETGGLALTDAKPGTDSIQATFLTKQHTGSLVPIFAFGPGAQQFSGFMQNTVFKAKLEKLLKLSK